MTEFVTLTTKGQLVIPSKLRRKLGLRKGTKVAVDEENGRLVLQPLTREYIASLYGSLRGKSSAMSFLLSERKKDRIL